MNALIFILISCGYLAADLLNYSQTGKNIGHALFPFLCIWAWSRLNPLRSHRSNTKWYMLVATILFLFMGFQAFLRGYFGVEHNDGLVIDAIFNTSSTESGEFLLHNVGYLVKFITLFLASMLLYWIWLRLYAEWLDKRKQPVSAAQAPRLGRTMAVVAPVLLIALHFNPTARRSNPILYFPIEYTQWADSVKSMVAMQEQLSKTIDDKQLQSMVYTGNSERTVVFILGESQTRLNYGLYGYPRDTTPRLDGRKSELTVYTDALSAGDGTVKSIKQMLTPADQEQPDLWNKTPSIINVAKQAGYKVFWISNQESSAHHNGTIGALIGSSDVIRYTNIGGPRGEGSLDEKVLPHLEMALQDHSPLKLIFVHILGAHPAYHFRYPKTFAGFEDAEDEVSKSLAQKGRNAYAIHQRGEYDNAIRYSDHILGETLDLASKYSERSPVAWLFLPDHGEDVAHYNNFTGHNGRVNAMWEVPMVFWASEGFDRSQIVLEPSRPFQSDQLPHALMGLMSVRGAYYESGEDPFSGEFRHQTRYVMNKKPYTPEGPSSEVAVQLANQSLIQTR